MTYSAFLGGEAYDPESHAADWTVLGWDLVRYDADLLFQNPRL